MLTCETAETLIVAQADGVEHPGNRTELGAHLATCERCRGVLAANAEVRPVLMARPRADVPAHFVARVTARVSSRAQAEWLTLVDWRRWTEWMLPVAATLVLIAGLTSVVMETGSQMTTTETATAIESWAVGADDAGSAETAALRQDVSSEELMAAMLGAKTTHGEGERDDR